jgi:hypothetical protein
MTPVPSSSTDGAFSQIEEDGTITLHQWPELLIQAVAASDPTLLKQDEPMALLEKDIELFARSLAFVSFEKSEFEFIDFKAYSNHLKEKDFRLFVIGDERWLVYDFNHLGEKPEEVDLPIGYEHFNLFKWPDELIAQAGAKDPTLLRSNYGDAWAVRGSGFNQFADYWLFEGYCDPHLFPFVDVERFRKETAEKFTKLVANGETWFAHSGENNIAALNGEIEVKKKDLSPLHHEITEIPLTYWPDSLVASVAKDYPDVFRARNYESIMAVRDENITTTLTTWSEGFEEEISKEGSLEAWIEMVEADDFSHLEMDGEKWWIYRSKES